MTDVIWQYIGYDRIWPKDVENCSIVPHGSGDIGHGDQGGR